MLGFLNDYPHRHAGFQIRGFDGFRSRLRASSTHPTDSYPACRAIGWMDEARRNPTQPIIHGGGLTSSACAGRLHAGLCRPCLLLELVRLSGAILRNLDQGRGGGLDPGRAGRGGWSWYSGAAGWLYRARLEALLGLILRGGELEISACRPIGQAAMCVFAAAKPVTGFGWKTPPECSEAGRRSPWTDCRSKAIVCPCRTMVEPMRFVCNCAVRALDRNNATGCPAGSQSVAASRRTPNRRRLVRILHQGDRRPPWCNTRVRAWTATTQPQISVA